MQLSKQFDLRVHALLTSLYVPCSDMAHVSKYLTAGHHTVSTI